MAISSFIDGFALSTGAAGTEQVRTGYGFQPKAIIAVSTGRTDSSDAVGTGATHISFGAGTSTSSRFCSASAYSHTAADGTSYKTLNNDALVASMGLPGGPTVLGLWDISAIGADGFTLVVDDALTSGYRAFFLALGGDGIEQVASGSFELSAATGDQSITSVGFEPDAVLFFGNGQDDFSATATGSLFVGAAAGKTIKNAVTTFTDLDAADPTDSTSYSIEGECIARSDGTANGIRRRASVTAWLSNGFTINKAEASFTIEVCYVAFKAKAGSGFRIGTGTTATDTNAFNVDFGIGFTPTCGLVFSHMTAQSASDTTDSDAAMSIGAFSSTSSEFAYGIRVVDNQANVVAGSAIDYNSCYVRLTADSTALDGEMNVTGLNGRNLEFTMGNADPDAAFFWVLAGGSLAPSRAAPIFF